MNIVLSGLTGLQSFVYLEDIAVYDSSLQNHNEHLKYVFNRLREHNMKLQPAKCELLRKEATYLSHVITDQGIRPNSEKIEATLKINRPQNPKDIKSFLGLIGYYRGFVPNF